MNKHLIVGTFGSSDLPQITVAPNEKITKLPLVGGSNTLNFGLSIVIEDLISRNVYPSEVGLDLLITAAHVYAADTRISRETESQDSWTREIKLIIPVSNPAVWNNVNGLLVRLLNFLTGDRWQLEFRTRPEKYSQLIPQKNNSVSEENKYNKVQLFSGGLDSLIGTINNLEAGNSPLLISHAGDGLTSKAQEECFDILKEHYETGVFDRLRLWMNIPNEIFDNAPIEDTTRGRSFLFFSLGVFAGTGLSSPFILETPENGLIALNVPLNLLRLGSLSTHTTHPYYMNVWNEILAGLEINGKIKNPYWKDTKGQMVQDCSNKELLIKALSHSLSCSSPAKGRWKGKVGHCGYCLPCLIRRASILSDSSIVDNTPYTLGDLKNEKIDTLVSDGQQIRSFQLAISKIKKNRDLAKLLIHKSGPLPKDSEKLEKLENVYYNGMMEVDRLLEGVITEPKK